MFDYWDTYFIWLAYLFIFLTVTFHLPSCRQLFYLEQGDRLSRTELHTPGVVTCGMDGSQHRFIYRDRSLIAPSRLTLDRINQRIYFTAPYANAIITIDYTGNNRYAVVADFTIDYTGCVDVPLNTNQSNNNRYFVVEIRHYYRFVKEHDYMSL